MTPWWERHNEYAAPGNQLSAAALSLLREVAEAFTVTGSDTPGWPDPHLDPDVPFARRNPEDEEYERCLDPGRYALTQARGAAWVKVLQERKAVASLKETHPGPGRAVLNVSPRRGELGAQPLVLKYEYFIFDTGHAPCLEVWAGQPALKLSEAPDCACDACDSGSDDLLEMIDKAIFSVIDGSVIASVEPRSASLRTSFGAESRSPGRTVRGQGSTPVKLVAGPWLPGWTSRVLLKAPRGFRH